MEKISYFLIMGCIQMKRLDSYLRNRQKSKNTIRGRKNRQQHRRLMITAGVCVCLCFFVMLAVGGAASVGDSKEVVIRLTADSAEITQDEQVPELKAKAGLPENTGEKKKRAFLSKDAEYTIQDLEDDLNKGNGYEIECDADGTEEGTFPVRVKLSSDLRNSLESEWLGKVRLEIREGKVKVRNRFGSWEGEKFKKNDGSYAAEDFIESKGKTFYFDAGGNFVKGWQRIGGLQYYFEDDGGMKTGWHKEKGASYYLKEDGSAATGWLTIGNDRYYFDAEGKMLTGSRKIGVQQCEFGEDGKLKSITGGADKNKPMVALTFDDGPGKRTGELLAQLKKYNARATFFMLGQNVGKYPQFVKQMVETNCELGNHSYDHARLIKLDEKKVKEEIQSTNEAVRSACGQPSVLMRPPYGEINDIIKANVGMPMIMWSIDTLDWKAKNADTIVNTVMSTVKDGDIILIHDIHSWSVDAAIRLIPMLQEKGYQLVTVSELAEARGITMQNGGKYFNFYK